MPAEMTRAQGRMMWERAGRSAKAVQRRYNSCMDDRYSHEAERELEYEIHYQSLTVFVDRCLSHAPFMWDDLWRQVREESQESVRKMKKLFEDKRRCARKGGQ